MKDDLKVGDVVAFLWGVAEVRGTVAEVYGQKGHRQVVISLDPDVTVAERCDDIGVMLRFVGVEGRG